MSERPLVFLDTETTGLGPGRRIWELAMIRREPDGYQREIELFLPIDPSRAEPGALDVGRFYERHPQGVGVAGGPAVNCAAVQGVITGPNPAARPRPIPRPAARAITAVATAAQKVAQWTHGARLVAASRDYDTDTLAHLLRSQGYETRWKGVRDVLSMACGFTGDEDLSGLTACADALGVPVDKALQHTAMGDARVAMGVYDRVILGDPELDKLAALVKVEQP